MTTAGADLTGRASALLELGRVDEAKGLLAQRLAREPDDVLAWSELGRCHLHVQEYGEALEATGSALALDPAYSDALVLRTYALRRSVRTDEALETAQEAVRVAPHLWQAYVALAEALNAWQPRWPEALDAALEAVRLGPQAEQAHKSVWKAATINGRHDLAKGAIHEVLRIDPNNPWALGRLAESRATAPGTRAKKRAEVYAAALAADPSSASMRNGLDRAVFQLLRGTRWFAVFSLLLAAVAVDVFPTDGDAPDLPLALGQRLYVLLWIAGIWAIGAAVRYRKLRSGVRMSMWSLVRRMFWARLVLCQAALGTLCAVALIAVPWSERGVPQALFWVGLVPTLLTIWFDRPRGR